jgi:hypothetical protein
LLLAGIAFGADRRWQAGRVEPGRALLVALGGAVGRAVAGVAAAGVAPRAALGDERVLVVVLRSFLALAAALALGRFVVAGIAALALAAVRIVLELALVIAELVLIAIVAARALLVLLRARVGDDAEIVVRELQVLFGLHPVAVQGGVVRQLLVLFQHLRRVAARAAVDPVALVAPALATIVAAAAAIVVPIVVVQGNTLPCL